MPDPHEPIDINVDPDNPDPEDVMRILEAIPGALDRIRQGSAQIRAGDVIPLEDF